MRVPVSTYRVQIHGDFDLDAAASLAPYLRRLGVSHLYSSPLLAAVPGSTHGYDVVDPTRVDPERGGEEAFGRLSGRLREQGMGLVVDIVPNHVAVLTADNPAWQDVLRHGPDSPAARRFDLAWRHDGDRPRLVLPVLGDHLDAVLDQIHLEMEDGEPLLTYHEHRFPLRPGSLREAGVDPDARPLPREELRGLLDRQHYELHYWRTGATILTHRRFFDVTSLGGLRVEDPEVAEWVLGRTLAMVAAGDVDGLRIDHPDGLRDPAGVFAHLRAAAPRAWIVAEKILEGEETLRSDWPVDGDVGYGFLNDLLALFVDADAEEAFTDLARQVTGQDDGHERIVREAKLEVVDQVLISEHRTLARMLTDVAGQAGLAVDDDGAATVVRELLVAFDVYRTYVVPERDEVAAGDRAAVTRAVDRARDRLERAHHPLLELLGAVLLLQRRGRTADDLAARFQQVTGPVMAKGVEDTTFYRNVRFVAVNEVGGAPGRFGTGPEVFHRRNEHRQARWPTAMVTTSTHDTKRSEDVRARLAVLSEVPDAWARAVERWRGACTPLRGRHGPDPATEYLAWQTVVGAWPVDGERLAAYLLKACREAKRATSWLDPDEDFEADLDAYARGLVEREAFVEPLEELLAVVRPAGRVVSLAQTLLRLTVPGVPDTYQGCELWDLSLVDPDNRRPVDWPRREQLLGMLEAGVDPERLTAGLVDPDDEGLAKLWVLRQALQLRRDRDLTVRGYRPLVAGGLHAHRVVSFLRGHDVLVVVPRLTVALGQPDEWTRDGGPREGSWGDTSLVVPAGRWTNLLDGSHRDGGRASLADLLGRFPVALLTRDEEPA